MKKRNPDPSFIDSVIQSIDVVNRHSKVALDNKPLYHLKATALNQLISSGYAHKVGLHFSRNPKNSQNHSTVFVKMSTSNGTIFGFHLPATKDDVQKLPHLGNIPATANPKVQMGIRRAKNILQEFIRGINPYFYPNVQSKPSNKRQSPHRFQAHPRQLDPSIFVSSFLNKK